LVWRDLKVRYKQTALGAAWAVIQPLSTMLIFTVFFGEVIGVRTDGVPYALFAYIGLLPWTYFSNAVNSSANSLVINSNLITKVYFPRVLIPAAATAAGLVDFGATFVILLGLMVYYKIGTTWLIVLLPFPILLTVLLALAVGVYASAVNVRYRDVRYVMPFVIQLWMFATPIIYPVTILPAGWRWLMTLNPLTGIVETYRALVLGHAVDWLSLAGSSAVTGLLLSCALIYFVRTEESFADLV